MKREQIRTERELRHLAATGTVSRRDVLRRGIGAGLGLAAAATLAATPRSTAAKGTSIPPNCIYVCCDGTCDSWTMCLKCVKWPEPKTVASR